MPPFFRPFAVAREIKTARGLYRLEMAEGPSRVGQYLSFVVSAVRADGIERVTFRCSVEEELAATLGGRESAVWLDRAAAWLAGDFDHLREAALRSIRTERRMAEFVFDHEHPGPFRL